MKNKVFESDNFPLCAYLLSKSCLLLMVKKDNPKRAVFVFEDTPDRERLTNDFFSSRGSVEPNSYFAAQRNLKQLIYRQ
ncbi:MAG: DUF5659 domain-containing protein [Candidatus Daviesbacteria bacterium]|nr:DUF5659 domain-containing protein [Candidatus Daviesbacteria bacterium]